MTDIQDLGYGVHLIGLNHGKFALYSSDDEERVAALVWRASLCGDRLWYAYAQVPGGGTIMMHRHLLGLERGDKRRVDHINHDGLDNRRENIRLVTQAQNIANARKRRGTSSRFKGVSRYSSRSVPVSRGIWQAHVYVNGKGVHLGLFDDEVEAARAYNAAAKRLRGEFALLNEVE